MRILVTGGAGFIGSHYVRTMLSGGYPGYEDAAVTVLDREGHDRRYCMDDSALRDMGYAPRVPDRKGLEETARWYADHRSWREPLKRPAAAVTGSMP